MIFLFFMVMLKLHNNGMVFHVSQNWLPRRVMSASRVAGIVHALKKWDVNECGDIMFSIEKVWQASLELGFRPLMTPNIKL